MTDFERKKMRQVQKKPCICRVNSSFELSMKQWDGSDGSYVSYSKAGLHINVRGRGPFLYVTYGSRFLLRITYNAGKTQNFLQSLIDKEQINRLARRTELSLLSLSLFCKFNWHVFPQYNVSTRRIPHPFPRQRENGNHIYRALTNERGTELKNRNKLFFPLLTAYLSPK